MFSHNQIIMPEDNFRHDNRLHAVHSQQGIIFWCTIGLFVRGDRLRHDKKQLKRFDVECFWFWHFDGLVSQFRDLFFSMASINV